VAGEAREVDVAFSPMGGERWIVDGMNVIGSRPDGWWRDRRGAMRSLVAELAEWADGREVVVVFDGRPFDIHADGVEVLFASRRGRNAADDDIVRLVEADPAPGELRIVTSDADLSRRAVERGADVMSAGSFRRMLDE
jgi:predicted RNA-binding protein with PIN domain